MIFKRSDVLRKSRRVFARSVLREFELAGAVDKPPP